MIILKITAEDNQNRKKKKTATRLARQSKKQNSGNRFPLPRGESFFFYGFHVFVQKYGVLTKLTATHGRSSMTLRLKYRRPLFQRFSRCIATCMIFLSHYCINLVYAE
jgi:hypothetical protein